MTASALIFRHMTGGEKCLGAAKSLEENVLEIFRCLYEQLPAGEISSEKGLHT